MSDKLTDVTDNKVGKMTDSEIVKALEDCLKNECDKCFLKDSETCQIDLMKLLFDLLNRQQATIETLRSCVEQHHIIRKDGKCSLSLIKAEAYKECIEKVKEYFNKKELVCSGALVRTDYIITDKELNNFLEQLVGEYK